MDVYVVRQGRRGAVLLRVGEFQRAVPRPTRGKFLTLPKPPKLAPAVFTGKPINDVSVQARLVQHPTSKEEILLVNSAGDMIGVPGYFPD